MKNIEITGCHDCPFYQNDSDEGESCYHGINLDNYRSKDVFLSAMDGGMYYTDMPAKCPLLADSFTISMTDKMKELYLKSK